MVGTVRPPSARTLCHSSAERPPRPLNEEEGMVVHPPSIRPFGLAALASSGPVALRHPKLTTYRCFLPDLTGFMALRRVGPGPQRCSAQPVPRYTNLGQEFSPAIAACGYRAPLAPRLARPRRSYHAPTPRQERPVSYWRNEDSLPNHLDRPHSRPYARLNPPRMRQDRVWCATAGSASPSWPRRSSL